MRWNGRIRPLVPLTRLCPSEWKRPKARRHSDRMTSLGGLRLQRHAIWLADLTRGLHAFLATERSKRDRQDQIDLFGSRARNDWDGLSDTDLLVV